MRKSIDLWPIKSPALGSILSQMVIVALALSLSLPSSYAAAAELDKAHSATVIDFAHQVDIGGGRRLYLECKGAGSPAVILESGIHDSSDVWSLTETKPPVLSSPSVFEGVARFTRVCRYDRPGTIRYTDPPALTTRSTPLFAPRTLRSMANDLRTLLMKARIPAPYVLVGHSYGGMILRLFAQTYPSDAAGLVLVDAFSPELKPLLSAADWSAYVTLVNHPRIALEKEREFETADISRAIEAVLKAPPLPRIPLAVISKTEPFGTAPGTPKALMAKVETAWPKAQDELVNLMPQTPHILATGSDHYVQIHDPDLVIGAIHLIFDRAKHARQH
jgi:pimeloyl-ACP methyl ester carboxylesterase